MGKQSLMLKSTSVQKFLMSYNIGKKGNTIMMKFVFFLVFYVGFGTASIYIPILIKGVIRSEISIGLLTIVMATVCYNASEKMLQLYSEHPKMKMAFFINLIAFAIVSIIAIVLCIGISQGSDLLIWSISLYVLSLLLWWYHNWDNKNLENTSAIDTMGGNNGQFNKL